MGKMVPFKDEFTLEERLDESREIITKYPNRVPVIVERYSSTKLPDMEKKKFLVPRDMSVGQFIHILSSRLRLPPGKALFIFVRNTLPQTASLMESVYETFKDEDGFLYMCYSSEKTFGSQIMWQVIQYLFGFNFFLPPFLRLGCSVCESCDRKHVFRTSHFVYACTPCISMLFQVFGIK